MGKFLGTITVPVIAGDPSSPANGDLWYNSSTSKFRKRQGGATSDMDTTGSGGTTWNTTTGTSATLAASNGYIANNASLVTYTLPASASVGDEFIVTGKGAGGWKIAQNASQVIYFGDMNTTTGTGGYIASVHQRDTVRIICITANTDFQVINSIGNITIV